MELRCSRRRVRMPMEMLTATWLLLLLLLSPAAQAWDADWQPQSVVRLDDDPNVHQHTWMRSSWRQGVQRFSGKEGERDDFRLLLAEKDSMLVAARNTIYNISMVTLQKSSEIVWEPEQFHIGNCQIKQKTMDDCQNYIRVLVKKTRDTLFVCGTNAFKPMCRTYNQLEDGSYRVSHLKEVDGVAQCPFDPTHNSTAVYADGKLYTATVADFASKDPLIYESSSMIRTEQYDSKWLNEPNFVSSMEKEDKVYFFLRETAVENINCGKAVFSRVARVCKQDPGGSDMLLKNTFTSYFKARLNCSVPGDFPFYFDEIQSTTELGKGNYRPTYDSGDRDDMVYAVFNTPENSIHGSAVCAFRYKDIVSTFEGRFKGQKSAHHNWLTVATADTPTPHPVQCRSNGSSRTPLPDNTLNFIKSHPLMNNAVPASGSAPLLLHTSVKAQFTKIAVDWQVHAADDRYYDIIFVGTTDGRVIKAVNKGAKAKVETVVIEDIQVFGSTEPVTDLKVYRDKVKGVEKLIVVSTESVVSIPLHRCEERHTCRTCVELRDPYCAWKDSRCVNAERGLQNIVEGWRSGWEGECEEVTIYESTKPAAATVSPTMQGPVQDKCQCGSDKTALENPVVVEEEMDTLVIAQDKEIPGRPQNVRKGGPRVGESSEETPGAREALAAPTVETLAIAVVVSIVLSMLVGFLIGYKVAGCRSRQDADASYLERTCSLQRSRNRLSSGEHPIFINQDHGVMPKQLNYAVNVKGKLNTAAVETKPVTKSNKVYL